MPSLSRHARASDACVTGQFRTNARRARLTPVRRSGSLPGSCSKMAYRTPSGRSSSGDAVLACANSVSVSATSEGSAERPARDRQVLVAEPDSPHSLDRRFRDEVATWRAGTWLLRANAMLRWGVWSQRDQIPRALCTEVYAASNGGSGEWHHGHLA